MARRSGNNYGNSTANLGFEAKLWLAADKLRSNMDAAEYKHTVLGLIFLKYISDSFEEKHAQLTKEPGADAEDPDEYKAENVFWVPPAARWSYLQNSAKQATIGKIVDDAMVAIERDNQRLKGVLPKDYARPGLDKHRLGELIDLIGSISFQPSPAASRHPLPVGEGPGEGRHRVMDILGRVYEYFLGQFASAEGKKGGQFYTPQSVVRVLVEMLAPYKGRIYDPCCGFGPAAAGFVQSEKFVEAHGGKMGDISIYGQESNPITCRLAVMNLALRGIEADFGPPAAAGPYTFRRDRHPDLRADYVLANPPSTTPTGFAKTTTCAGSMASRPGTTPTSPGCSTSSTTSRPRNGGLRPRFVFGFGKNRKPRARSSTQITPRRVAFANADAGRKFFRSDARSWKLRFA
ncbi:hypothetical protein BH18VER1_BH18VER1_09060 [soil metagenome]